MSDTSLTPLDQEDRKIKFDETHAAEVGLPSPGAINYMVSIANLVSTSCLFTPDLLGDLKGPDANQPTPQNHVAGDANCPCHHCEHRRRLTQVMKSNALAKMLFGWEMQIHPLQALTSIFIVKGRMSVHYSKLLERIRAHGYTVEITKWDIEGCILTASRADLPKPIVSVFGPEETKRAELGKDYTGRDGRVTKSQYSLRPEVMYLSKAVGKLYRVLGVSGPVVYTQEEAREIEDTPNLAPPTPESIDRRAGVDDAAQIDEEIIPPETQSLFKDAAHKVNVPQGEVARRLLEIQREAQKTPEANPRDIAAPLLAAFMAELAQIAAQKIANGGTPAPRKRGRPPNPKPMAVEQAVQSATIRQEHVTDAEPALQASPVKQPVDQQEDFPDPLA